MLWLRARRSGREPRQEMPASQVPLGHGLVGMSHSLYLILPRLSESGTAPWFDRRSATEFVRVTQLRSGGATCVGHQGTADTGGRWQRGGSSLPRLMTGDLTVSLR